MGQRHRAFLIARIIPEGRTEAKYRCIAAIHHQWLYGTLPLEAANRFIRLVKQPQNAMIVREELKTLHGKYGRRGENCELPKIPAPYCIFLLQSAFYTDITASEPIASFKYFKDANMGSLEGDNKEGITVIDVTNPEDPCYCFIQSRVERRILSANGLVRSYYPLPFPQESYARDADRPRIPRDRAIQVVVDPDFNKEIEDLIANYSDVKLIESYMLAEAWPDEYKLEDPSSVPSLNESAKEQLVPTVLPLVQISLKPAVISAVENDNLNALDHYLSDPEIIHALKQIIIAESSLQAKSVPLLSKLVAKELEADSMTTIDLSDFALTSEQIIDLLMLHQNICSLNLSRNLNVTAKTLEGLLTNLKSLRRLILFDTGITRDDLVALLRTRAPLFYQLNVLIHPALLNQMDEDLAWASDYGNFTFKTDPNFLTSTDVTLPFFSPAQVIQTIISLFSASRRARIYQTFFESIPFFQAAYAVEYKGEEQGPWSDRHVPMCPQSIGYSSFLRLRGWLFLWYKPYFYPRKENPDWNHTANNLYAWIRFNEEAVENCEALHEIQDPVKRGWAAVEELGEELFEVYDLEGFLNACVEEGRPPVPESLRRTALEWVEKWKKVDLDVTAPGLNLGADPEKAKKIKASMAQTFRPITSARRVLELYKDRFGSHLAAQAERFNSLRRVDHN